MPSPFPPKHPRPFPVSLACTLRDTPPSARHHPSTPPHHPSHPALPRPQARPRLSSPPSNAASSGPPTTPPRPPRSYPRSAPSCPDGAVQPALLRHAAMHPQARHPRWSVRHPGWHARAAWRRATGRKSMGVWLPKGRSGRGAVAAAALCAVSLGRVRGVGSERAGCLGEPARRGAGRTRTEARGGVLARPLAVTRLHP